MTEKVLVNGVSLDTYAFMLGDSSGLMITPPLRKADVDVSGRHGTLPAPIRRYGPGKVVLKLAVLGAMPDGSIPGGSTERRQFFARRDELIALFHAPSVVLDYTPEDGVTPIRRAVCELDDEMSFKRVAAEPIATVPVVLRIPDSFWSDVATTTASGTVASGGTISLAGFAGSNAPITDGVVTFGPGSNPTLIQGGVFVAYDGVIAAGRQLTLDCSDWSVGIGSGSAWTPDRGAVRYDPGPSWFEFDPLRASTATLTHTGGSTMLASFTGRRRYMTA